MGRYFKGAVASPSEYVYEMPLEEMDASLMKADQNISNNITLGNAAKTSIGEISALNGQADIRDEIIGSYEEEIDAITGQIKSNPLDFMSMNEDLMDLSTRINKDITRGNLANIQSNYDLHAAHLKSEKERLKEGKITQEAFNAVYSKNMKDFNEAVKNGEDPAQARINLVNTAENFDGLEYILENLKGMEVDESYVEEIQGMDGGQFIVKTSQGIKKISPEKIFATVVPMLNQKAEYQAMMRQGIEYGYKSGKLDVPTGKITQVAVLNNDGTQKKDSNGKPIYRDQLQPNEEHAYYNELTSAIRMKQKYDVKIEHDVQVNDYTMAKTEHVYAQAREATKQNNRIALEGMKNQFAAEQAELDRQHDFDLEDVKQEDELEKIHARGEYSGSKKGKKGKESKEEKKAKDWRKQGLFSSHNNIKSKEDTLFTNFDNTIVNGLEQQHEQVKEQYIEAQKEYTEKRAEIVKANPKLSSGAIERLVEKTYPSITDNFRNLEDQNEATKREYENAKFKQDRIKNLAIQHGADPEEIEFIMGSRELADTFDNMAATVKKENEKFGYWEYGKRKKHQKTRLKEALLQTPEIMKRGKDLELGTVFIQLGFDDEVLKQAGYSDKEIKELSYSINPQVNSLQTPANFSHISKKLRSLQKPDTVRKRNIKVNDGEIPSYEEFAQQRDDIYFTVNRRASDGENDSYMTSQFLQQVVDSNLDDTIATTSIPIDRDLVKVEKGDIRKLRSNANEPLTESLNRIDNSGWGIFDKNAKMRWKEDIEQGHYSTSIPLGGVAPGHYVINIHTERSNVVAQKKVDYPTYMNYLQDSHDKTENKEVKAAIEDQIKNASLYRMSTEMANLTEIDNVMHHQIGATDMGSIRRREYNGIKSYSYVPNEELVVNLQNSENEKAQAIGKAFAEQWNIYSSPSEEELAQFVQEVHDSLKKQ